VLHEPVADADRLLSVTAVPGHPGRVVVEAVGVVDTYTAPLLDLCLRSQTARPGLRALVVDVRRVGYLGTAGVQALVRASRRCDARGARLVVHCGGSRPVLAALRSAGPDLDVAGRLDPGRGPRVGAAQVRGTGGRRAARTRAATTATSPSASTRRSRPTVA
jgi:anti-sigma B factor antagonist